jgi:hypothetical protein
LRPFWDSFAPFCESVPSKEHCDDGDMTLFTSLLCSSGYELSCKAAKESQASNGRWYRSPRRARTENLGTRKSFSRDMSMGVLVYLVHTKDREAAQKWLQWIDQNRPCSLEKPGGGCWVRGLHRVCRDDENFTCTITPGLWALMGRVWTHLGLERHEEMKRYEGLDGDMATIETIFTESGYPQHLKGVAVYLKQLLNVDADWRRENAQILVERQPLNPFFRYLLEGPSQAVIDRVYEACPKPGFQGPYFQWSWERQDENEAWKKSMGWDCIFMHNVLKR